MDQINILIADDQVLLRDALQTILNLEDDLSVVGFAKNGKEAYDLVGQIRPHLVLMDVKMPMMNGIESTRLIKRDYPNTIILILSTFAEDDDIVACLAEGALGYILKDIKCDHLINTIREALQGHFILPSVIAAKLASKLYLINKGRHPLPNQQANKIELTEREKEIADLMAKGFNNREIASDLFISEGTVRNYISNLYS